MRQSVASPEYPTRRSRPAWLRPLAVEAVVISVMTAILLRQVVLPPVIGLADNGDWGRIGVTLQVLPNCIWNECHDYVWTQFTIAPAPPWSVKTQLLTEDRRFLTSELLPVRVAFFVNGLISPPGTFDLRVLGAIHAILFVGAVWLLLWSSRPLGAAFHAALALALGFVGTDLGYFQYFNSLYSEPASLIGLLLVVATGLAWLLTPRAGGRHLAAFYASALFFVTAKPQNAPLALPLAMFGGYVALRVHRYLPLRSLALPALLCSLAAVYFLAQPHSLQRYNLYNLVFLDILKYSPAPERDLAALGLNQQELLEYAASDDRMVRDKETEADRRENAEDQRLFYQNISYARIALFYARHPERLLDLAVRSSRHLLSHRVDLANYERSSGRGPDARSEAFTHWTSLRERFFPRSASQQIGLLGTIAFTGVCAWSLSRKTRFRHAPLIIPLLLSLGLFEFVVVMMGGEVEMTKHMFLVTTSIDLLLIGTVAIIISGALRALRGTGLTVSPSPHVPARVLGRR